MGDPPPSALLQKPSATAIRDKLESLVLADLLGPAGGPEEEVDERRVSERYLVGMLAPRKQRREEERYGDGHDPLAIATRGTLEEGPSDDVTLTRWSSVCVCA